MAAGPAAVRTPAPAFAPSLVCWPLTQGGSHLQGGGAVTAMPVAMGLWVAVACLGKREKTSHCSRSGQALEQGLLLAEDPASMWPKVASRRGSRHFNDQAPDVHYLLQALLTPATFT